MNPSPLRKILFALAPGPYRQRLEARARGGEFNGLQVIFTGDREEILREIADADVLCAPDVDDKLIADARQLQWIQLLRGGLIKPLPAALVESPIIVTCFKELFAAPGAEFALMAMLMVSRRMTLAVGHDPLPQTSVPQDQTLRPVDLAGSTIGLIGLGNIGRRIAELARAFNVKVLGSARTDQHRAAVDEFFPLAELEKMAARVDYLLTAVPVTPNTVGLIGDSLLAALKPSAWLIDVSARPQLLDYAAITRALDEKRLGGVVLQPVAMQFAGMPAADSDFWRRPNVIVSPCRCISVEQETATVELIPDNLLRWQKGHPLRGLVNKAEGY